MKRISRIGTDRVNLKFEIVVLQPITRVHYQVSFHVKSQVYRKLPIEFSNDMCDWLNGKGRSKLLDTSMGRVMKFIEYDHKLECPFKEGNFSLNIYNVSLNEQFPFIPILPSGQYRVDTILSAGHRNDVVVKFQFFMAISDKRIEQYDNFDDLANFEH